MVGRGGGSPCGGSVAGTPQALQPRLSSDVALAAVCALLTAGHLGPREHWRCPVSRSVCSVPSRGLRSTAAPAWPSLAVRFPWPAAPALPSWWGGFCFFTDRVKTQNVWWVLTLLSLTLVCVFSCFWFPVVRPPPQQGSPVNFRSQRGGLSLWSCVFPLKVDRWSVGFFFFFFYGKFRIEEAVGCCVVHALCSVTGVRGPRLSSTEPAFFSGMRSSVSQR